MLIAPKIVQIRQVEGEQRGLDDPQQPLAHAARATCGALAHERMSAREALSVRRARKDPSIEPIRVHSYRGSTGYMGGLTCQAVVPSVRGEAHGISWFHGGR